MRGKSKSPAAVSSSAEAGPAATLRKGPRSRPLTLGATVSRDAQRTAAAILEVLAGVRTPTDAALALSVTLPRYYLWEQRAIEGLVRACEPRPVGKAAGERHRIAVLEKEVARLKRDCARQQALVRASQRTFGLATSPTPVAKPAVKSNGKAKRKRRPVARALKAVAALRVPVLAEGPSDSSSWNGVDVVQHSAASGVPPVAEMVPSLAVATQG